MDYYSPAEQDQIKKDIEHVKLLGVFYYVLAGLAAFGALITLIYVVIGVVIAIAAASESSSDPDAEEVMAIAGIFAVFGCMGFVLNGLIGYLDYLTGRNLRSFQGKTLIQIVAGLTCLSFPLGTVLGVFTFIVLNRPTVQQMFAQGGPPDFDAAPPPPPAAPPQVPPQVPPSTPV